jgi:hypothetical protein
MNERHLFRAKRTDAYKKGEWAVGLLSPCREHEGAEWGIGIAEIDHIHIGVFAYRAVDTSTICQCLGKSDENGIMFSGADLLFEDDIITSRDYHGERRGVVKFHGSKYYLQGFDGFSDEYLFNQNDIVVIGNIHDHPELIER